MSEWNPSFLHYSVCYVTLLLPFYFAIHKVHIVKILLNYYYYKVAHTFLI